MRFLRLIALLTLVMASCDSAAQFVVKKSRKISEHPFMYLLPLQPKPKQGQESTLVIQYTLRQPTVGSFPKLISSKLRYRIEKVELNFIEVSVLKRNESEDGVSAKRIYKYRYDYNGKLLQARFQPLGESRFKKTQLSDLVKSRACYMTENLKGCIILKSDYTIVKTKARSAIKTNSIHGVIEGDAFRWQIAGPDISNIALIMHKEHPLHLFKAAVQLKGDSQYNSIEIACIKEKI